MTRAIGAVNESGSSRRATHAVVLHYAGFTEIHGGLRLIERSEVRDRRSSRLTPQVSGVFEEPGC